MNIFLWWCDMSIALKSLKIILNIFFLFILLIALCIIFIPAPNPSEGNIVNQSLTPFALKNGDVTHQQVQEQTETKGSNPGMSESERNAVLNKAKAMTEVKWSPKYNLVDTKGPYIFIKGKTYYGVPYSMDSYQVNSSEDFSAKIKDSKTLYGNDCSGFVSAVWGLSRQTTLTIYNAVNDGNKIDGKAVEKIAWEELKPADALLLDNGKGEGHIMLFISTDSKNSDNIIVYEQNVVTITPFEPIPVARKDTRSKEKMINAGYIPIRLVNK
jgi:hypothetical protein